MKLIVHAACGLALAASSVPALAEVEQSRAVVSYGDLDLSSEKDIKLLDRRVKRAIRRVCWHARAALWERLHQRSCIQQATLDADKQIARAVRQARTRPAPSGSPTER